MTKPPQKKLKTVKEMLDILAKKLSAEEYITFITFLESMYMGFDFGYNSVQKLDQEALESFLKQEKNQSKPWPVPFKAFFDFGRGDYELDDDGYLRDRKIHKEYDKKADILPFPGRDND